MWVSIFVSEQWMYNKTTTPHNSVGVSGAFFSASCQAIWRWQLLLCCNKEGELFTFLARASCVEHPKYVEQVGAEQEPHSSLFGKNWAARRHPVDHGSTHSPPPSAVQWGQTAACALVSIETEARLNWSCVTLTQNNRQAACCWRESHAWKYNLIDAENSISQCY